MNRILLVLSVFLIAASFCFTAAARAESDPETDYCLQRADTCMTGCERYNVRLWGSTWPTPRTALCIGECTAAYVGCFMLRFREGV